MFKRYSHINLSRLNDFYSKSERWNKICRESDPLFNGRCGKIEEGFFAIDLHGCRRNAAELIISEFLQWLRRNKINCGRIIHGKGTGVMRDVSYEILKRHPVKLIPCKAHVDFYFQPVATSHKLGKLSEVLKIKEHKTYRDLYNSCKKESWQEKGYKQVASQKEVDSEVEEVLFSSLPDSQINMKEEIQQDVLKSAISKECFVNDIEKEEEDDFLIFKAFLGAIVGFFISSFFGLIISIFLEFLGYNSTSIIFIFIFLGLTIGALLGYHFDHIKNIINKLLRDLF